MGTSRRKLTNALLTFCWRHFSRLFVDELRLLLLLFWLDDDFPPDADFPGAADLKRLVRLILIPLLGIGMLSEELDGLLSLLPSSSSLQESIGQPGSTIATSTSTSSSSSPLISRQFRNQAGLLILNEHPQQRAPERAASKSDSFGACATLFARPDRVLLHVREFLLSDFEQTLASFASNRKLTQMQEKYRPSESSQSKSTRSKSSILVQRCKESINHCRWLIESIFELALFCRSK